MERKEKRCKEREKKKKEEEEEEEEEEKKEEEDEEEKESWLEWICRRIIQQGPVPHHVAFIMDGNRRWARRLHLESTKGHYSGWDTLTKTLNKCRLLGIKEVTVYAFSIENFKRSKEEVDALMSLAREKIRELLESNFFKKHKFCFKLLGEITLLPRDVQELLALLIHRSRNNTAGVVNLGIAYTSRVEMMHSMKTLAQGVKEKIIQSSDVDEDLFQRCLYTFSQPDLLIRTSGETRLSDFLLWQSSFSSIQFLDVLWPDFSYWDMLKCCLWYQYQHKSIMMRRREYEKKLNEYEKKKEYVVDEHRATRIESFLKWKEARDSSIIQELLHSAEAN